jgi:hypothetical protein
MSKHCDEVRHFGPWGVTLVPVHGAACVVQPPEKLPGLNFQPEAHASVNTHGGGPQAGLRPQSGRWVRTRDF